MNTYQLHFKHFFNIICSNLIDPTHTSDCSQITLLLSYFVVSLLKKYFFFGGGETNRVKERPVIGRKSGGVEIADHTASVRRRRSVFEFSYGERETDTQK